MAVTIGGYVIFYFFSYFYLLSFFLVGYRYRVNYLPLLVFGMLPAFLLVVLRGDVGTDTASYLQILDSINVSSLEGAESEVSVEFGFELLSQVLLGAGLSNRSTLAILSGLACFLAFFAFSRKKDDAIVFVFLVFPVFFYDMTMNGVRYGIAFCFAKMAYDAVIERRNYVALLYVFAAFSFHVSSVILVFILLLRMISFKRFLFLCVLAFLVVSFYYERIVLRFSVYEDIKSPGGLSGVAPLFIFGLVYSALLVCLRRDFFYLSLVFVFELLCFLLAKYSYAGLRLQFLVLFSLFCSLSDLTVMSSKRRQLFLVCIVCIGFVGFLAKSRNMIDGEGVGDSPFLPYHFIWEVK